MRVTKDSGRITGSYALKFQLEKDIEKTKQDQAGNEQFIPEVADSILVELSRQLELVEERIQAKWDRAEEAGKDVVIQAAFSFYWDCDIDEDEVPF